MLLCPPALYSLSVGIKLSGGVEMPTLTYLLKDYALFSGGNAAIRGPAKIDLSVLTGRKSRDCSNSSITEYGQSAVLLHLLSVSLFPRTVNTRCCLKIT